MSFKFYRNGVEITPPRRIKWHFEENPNAIFESDPEKVETNANFWRKKLNVAKDARVVFVPNADYDIEFIDYLNGNTNFFNNDTNTNDDSSDSVSDNGLDLESGVSQDAEDTINTPKRRRKQETADVPPVSSELDDADSAVSE